MPLHDEPRYYGRRKGPGLSPNLISFLDSSPLFLDEKQMAGWVEKNQKNHPSPAIWLEIGCGSGESLLTLASNHPDDFFIGCDPYLNGIAKTARDATAAGLTNLRLYAEDARLLLARLPDHFLHRLLILFPDPWPKRRHWKRRIVGPETIPLFCQKLQAGGELWLASDHGAYMSYMLHYLQKTPQLSWQAKQPEDWRKRPAGWPETRYAQKRLAGEPCYLTYKKYDICF